jgi:HTH-type transcriptional regulator / antitoxin HipB
MAWGEVELEPEVRDWPEARGWIRSRREELGWSQRQLAERAGMTQPGIARFEAGGTTPTLPLLERLAAALGLTLQVRLEPAGRRSA